MALRKQILLVFSLVLIAPFFFLGGPEFDSTRSVNEFWNTGHILFFALLAIGLYEYWLPAAFSFLRKTGYIFFIVVVLGVGIEVLQLLGTDGRSVGWDDVARDIVGGVYVLFLKIGTNRRTDFQRIFWRFLAIGIVVAACIPLWLVLIDEVRAKMEFPILSGFEREAELGRWQGKGSLRLVTNPVRQGKYAAELRLSADKDSGSYLFYCPQDWRGKKALAFSVHNPGGPLELHFRVLDHLHPGHKQKNHHQYNDSTILLNGWNDILVSMETIKNGSTGGEMDFAHIWAFGLFVVEPQENRLLYLDDVQLLQ